MLQIRKIDAWPRGPLQIEPSQAGSAVLAYAAGMVDGEGHIALTQWGSSHLPIVQVTNTDARIIDWLDSQFPNGNRHMLVRNNVKHRTRLNWRLNGRRAYAFLRDIYPFLVAKRAQADVIFEYYDQGGYFHDGNNALPDTEKVRRAELHKRMKVLNARGPREVVP